MTSSADPIEALAIVQRDGGFEALVTDVVMAGMMGTELASRIEAICGPLPTIFMSGHTEDELIRSGVLAKHQRFMPKPFTPSELLAEVRRLIDARSATI